MGGRVPDVEHAGRMLYDGDFLLLLRGERMRRATGAGAGDDAASSCCCSEERPVPPRQPHHHPLHLSLDSASLTQLLYVRESS